MTRIVVIGIEIILWMTVGGIALHTYRKYKEDPSIVSFILLLATLMLNLVSNLLNAVRGLM